MWNSYKWNKGTKRRTFFNVIRNISYWFIGKCTKFDGVYSRNNLSKINDEAYIINLHEYEFIRTHWIALYLNAQNVTYFDSFGVAYILKEIKKFIGRKIS